jgi:hypothetical protein
MVIRQLLKVASLYDEEALKMLKHGSGTKGTRRSYTDIASRRGMFMRFGLMALLG